MSFKFPDNKSNKEFKNRKCFQCKKHIDFGEYYIRNKKRNIKRLIELWENDILEFYCCLCYDKYVENEHKYKLKESLIEKEREILKLLKLKLSIEIPIVNEIQYNTVGITILNKHITGLGLFKCIDFFPEEITMLTSLKKLNFAWNFLKKLPKSICNLKSLKELDLIGNKLTSLPKEIGKLSCLEELDLSINELTSIPNTLGELTSLKTLNLIHNKIITLPENLKDLELRGLKILF